MVGWRPLFEPLGPSKEYQMSGDLDRRTLFKLGAVGAVASTGLACAPAPEKESGREGAEEARVSEFALDSDSQRYEALGGGNARVLVAEGTWLPVSRSRAAAVRRRLS